VPKRKKPPELTFQQGVVPDLRYLRSFW